MRWPKRPHSLLLVAPGQPDDGFESACLPADLTVAGTGCGDWHITRFGDHSAAVHRDSRHDLQS
jgi:hypothetical protein